MLLLPVIASTCLDLASPLFHLSTKIQPVSLPKLPDCLPHNLLQCILDWGAVWTHREIIACRSTSHRSPVLATTPSIQAKQVQPPLDLSQHDKGSGKSSFLFFPYFHFTSSHTKTRRIISRYRFPLSRRRLRCVTRSILNNRPLPNCGC